MSMNHFSVLLQAASLFPFAAAVSSFCTIFCCLELDIGYIASLCVSCGMGENGRLKGDDS